MTKRNTILDIKKAKGSKKLVSLTAYSAPMANMLDPYVDIILVGDSMGMVMYGMENTLNVPLDMMIAHGKAVVGATSNALVVIDMPFGSYHVNKEQAFENAARIIKETGAGAVKIEGGEALAETVKFITDRGIPVLGHIGLMPQYVNQQGGYRYQGREEEEAQLIVQDAKSIEQSGAFAVLMEAVEASVAKQVTLALNVPTIGIGSSKDCDGQILVTEDILGLSLGKAPKFVKQYANLRSSIEQAVSEYADDVRGGDFPSSVHSFTKKSA